MVGISIINVLLDAIFEHRHNTLMTVEENQRN